MSASSAAENAQLTINDYVRLLDEKTKEFNDFVATSKEMEAELYAAMEEVRYFL
jgi:hypothetical protein